MDSNDPPPKKRKRFDWTTKTDPDTGAVTRFCSRCQEFLPLDRFYASTIKDGSLSCKTHCSQRTAAFQKKWRDHKRGKPRSLARIRSNLNSWIVRQKIAGWKKWSDDDVKQALIKHAVNLASETRIVRLRPADASKSFNVENSIVKFQNGSSSSSKSTTNV